MLHSQYYVFQGDMVSGIEDLRTPLHEILALESQIRGSIAGFMMPNFMVTLPGGGGKRLACSYDTYDRSSGRSTFLAPGSLEPDRRWEYWDPQWSLPHTSGKGFSGKMSEDIAMSTPRRADVFARG